MGRTIRARSLYDGNRWHRSDGWKAAPVLPYARYFAMLSNEAARRIARVRLGKIFPERNPMLIEGRRHQIADHALNQRMCLAASSAGQPGIVPGLSLWNELKHLQNACDDAELALHAGTGACQRLGIAAGNIIQGAAANLLCWDSDENHDLLPCLDRLSHIVLAGEFLSADQLKKEVEEMIELAMITKMD